MDPATTHQTIKGSEVTGYLFETNKKEDRYDRTWQDYQGEIFNRLVNELGINRIRIEIRSGAENPVDHFTQFETGKIGYNQVKRFRYQAINDNDDPDVADKTRFQFAELNHQVSKVLLPIRRLVEANGEKLFITLTYVDFDKTPGESGNLSHASRPEEYAELIRATFDHLKERFGITPDSLEVILEPDNTSAWRGREIGAALVAAAKRLRAGGYTPEVIAPSTSASLFASGYIDEMMEVPGVVGVVSTFSYHRYDGDLAARVALPRILERAMRFRVGTAMLEHLNGDVAELHDDLTRGNVSSWQQFGIAHTSPTGRGYYYRVDTQRKPSVQMAPRTRELAQYFRFVRAGAVRIDAASSSPRHYAVAFRNPNGAQVAIVQSTWRRGPISFVGLPAGTYGIRYTTAEETARDLPDVDVDPSQPLRVQIPAKGVLTVYQKGSAVQR